MRAPSTLPRAISNVRSQLAARLGDYNRRQDDWNHQANLAAIELKQIDQQLAAAQIRLAIAQQELRNHDQQIDNARATDEFLRAKFTNQELYQWMIGQVSGLYFQSYQLAYDLAKRAEICMQHELGLAYGETSFIRFGYWDSLKKGLLAADHLAYDLKRLEVAYLDGNVREYELDQARLAAVARARAADRSQGNRYVRVRDSGVAVRSRYAGPLPPAPQDGERDHSLRHRPVHDDSLQGPAY